MGSSPAKMSDVRKTQRVFSAPASGSDQRLAVDVDGWRRRQAPTVRVYYRRRGGMAKSITLRLGEDVYEEFREAAAAERRSLSNLIETAALARIRETQFVDDAEAEEILSDDALVQKDEDRFSTGSPAQGPIRCMNTGSSGPSNFAGICARSPGPVTRRSSASCAGPYIHGCGNTHISVRMSAS